MRLKSPRRSKPKLLVFSEPRLLFNYEQATEDPRDGLTLFGPLERGKPYGIRFAVVGTPDGIRRLRQWVVKAQLPIGNPADTARPTYPGFEAAFGIPWKPSPQFEIAIDETELHRRINFADAHHRVYKAVDLYEDAILKTKNRPSIFGSSSFRKRFTATVAPSPQSHKQIESTQGATYPSAMSLTLRADRASCLRMTWLKKCRRLTTSKSISTIS